MWRPSVEGQALGTSLEGQAMGTSLQGQAMWTSLQGQAMGMSLQGQAMGTSPGNGHVKKEHATLSKTLTTVAELIPLEGKESGTPETNLTTPFHCPSTNAVRTQNSKATTTILLLF